MYPPTLIRANSFQEAWIEGAKLLSNNEWNRWNLVVHISEPIIFNSDINNRIASFTRSNALIRPKTVAYTIFPQYLYRRFNSAQRVYDGYNDRLYPLTRKSPRRGWGTYFHRMINYDGAREVNQLKNIIDAINNNNSHDKVVKAAYTIVIEKPGRETVRPLGAPCLNYIAIQMQRVDESRRISLLATYRNHDFLNRAYGNYWGLCNLLNFIVRETDSRPGTLTCVSSRAYVDDKKTALKRLLEELE